MRTPDAYTTERTRLLHTFGARLRAAREQQGLSQETLARRADVHRTHIGALEQGHRDPHLSMLLILAEHLALPPAALLDGLPAPRERKPPTHAKHPISP
ncbi:MAG TPA: helix-turn-helix transcriptional regulator [Solirubrobacteraceae bacterium]|jgi:transcriptional regulator with XRE-family HTH domain|nr:helix-turn-helix transcriptional regulator [Solirubrobacteraceae bacterium]